MSLCQWWEHKNTNLVKTPNPSKKRTSTMPCFQVKEIDRGQEEPIYIRSWCWLLARPVTCLHCILCCDEIQHHWFMVEINRCRSRWKERWDHSIVALPDLLEMSSWVEYYFPVVQCKSFAYGLTGFLAPRRWECSNVITTLTKRIFRKRKKVQACWCYLRWMANKPKNDQHKIKTSTLLF